VSIGTGTYDPSPQLLAAYRNDPEAGVKMNVDDYVLNMKASSAFDQCYTFTYTTERSLPMVQQALAGVRQVRPPAGWGGGVTSRQRSDGATLARLYCVVRTN
jgi:hypothetical protein